MYLNDDGAGGKFGDTTIDAETSNISQSAGIDLHIATVPEPPSAYILVCGGMPVLLRRRRCVG